MAEQDTTAALEAQRNRGVAGADAEREVVVTGRLANTAAAPKHGNPTDEMPVGPHESVINVRVGSEAAVESGTDPVLPMTGPGVTEFTRVRNKDLRERDEKEFRKRGLRSDGVARPGSTVSMSFTGLMVVEREPDKDEKAGDPGLKQIVSGAFTGEIPEGGLTIRPLTQEEEENFLAVPRASSQRANDLVAGSGTGGGGNPMHAGKTRGTSSATAERVGQGGVTSAVGVSPPPRSTGPQR
jgi:hypothetical protein